MRKPRIVYRCFSLALLLLVSQSSVVSAQSLSSDATLPVPPMLQNLNQNPSSAGMTTPVMPITPSSEHIAMPAGQIVEIMGADAQLEYSWTFSRDGNFLGAARGHLFRTRVVQPGTYSLRVDATDMNHTVESQQEFLLDVSTVTANTFSGSGVPVDLSVPSASSTLFTTQPATTDHLIDLHGASVLMIQPASSDIATIDIDTNASVDSDGNGNPQDDHDTLDTFFHQAKNPLYIWFSNRQVQERPLRVLITLNSGQANDQDLTLVSSATQANQSTLTVQAQPTGPATVQFSLVPPPAPSAGNPLLTEWSFGDSTQSLTEQPIHTYVRNGTYAVTAQVRSLTTGRIVTRGQTSVVISDASGTTIGASVSSAVSSASVAATTNDSSGLLWLVLKIVFSIILIGGLFGGLLWAIFRLLRRRGFQSRLDDTLDSPASDRASSGSLKDVIDVPAAPLTLRRSEETKPVQTAPTPAPKAEPPRPVPPPAVTSTPASFTPAASSNAAPTPAWLQKGLATNDEQKAPLDTVPAPLPTSPNVRPEPASTPAWLQPKSSPPSAPPVTPAPLSTAPSPAPTIDETEAPAWLKKGLNTSTESNAPSSSTPIAAPAKPAVPAEPSNPSPPPSPAPKPWTPPPVSSPSAAPTAPPIATTTTPAPVTPPLNQTVRPVPPPSPTPATTTTPDTLPSWLQDASPSPSATVQTPAAPKPTEPPAESTKPAPVPPPLPVATKPIPAPQPTAASNTPATPKTTASAESSAPTSPVVSAPATAPTPSIEPPAPAPVPAATTPSIAPPVPPPTVSPKDNQEQEHDERERERKRRKRQRYRENLKRRKEAGEVSNETDDGPDEDNGPAPTAPTSDSLTPPAPPSPSSPSPTDVKQPSTPVASPALPPSPSALEDTDDDVAFVVRADSLDPNNSSPAVQDQPSIEE